MSAALAAMIVAKGLIVEPRTPTPAPIRMTAWSIGSHCGAGCLPATTMFTYFRLRRQWSVTDSRQLASGGR
jgi:hypothetical protein